MDKSYRALNDVLVKLFRDINDIEEEAITGGEFRDITNNDMHILEAVGLETPINMSAIAKRLSVTMGTLTISMNSLVKKGYVLRERSEQDRRVVLIQLTEKGQRAYHHHATFHREMIEAVIGDLDESEREILAGALNRLRDFFLNYQNPVDK